MAYQNFKRNEVGSFKNKCFLSLFKAKESIRSPPFPNFLPSKRKIKESPTTKELTFFFFFFAKHKRACARRVGTHVLKAKSSRSYEVDGVMFRMCFTLFFIKRIRELRLKFSLLHIFIRCYENYKATKQIIKGVSELTKELVHYFFKLWLFRESMYVLN